MAIRISRSELNALVQAEVEKQEKKLALEQQKAKLLEHIQKLDEEIGAPAAPAAAPVDTAPAPTGSPAPAPATAPKAPESNEPSESIFDAKPGETIIFNFQDVTIKVQRQLDDLFKVTDAAESKKLKDGDYVQIKGNDTLANGKSFKFDVLRATGVNYQSNPLTSWKIIKN